MDAREVIRHFLRGTDLSCDDLITALEWHSNRIIHRDENHGPTLERAAEMADVVKELHNGSEGSHPAFATASIIATSIRAMEVKHHG